MANCIVSGTFLTPDGAAASSVTVAARVPSPQVVGLTVITPFEQEVSTDASGNWSMTVQQSLSVIFTVTYPIVGTEPVRSFSYSASVPATTSANFVNIIVIE